jgi:hypothetical protein
MVRWRIIQTAEYARAVASVAPSTRAALAQVYRVLAQGPLPGESSLAVEPYAAVPNAFSVPVGDEGLIVYLVLPATRTVGLVGLVWLSKA